jgi:hypothetical protein
MRAIGSVWRNSKSIGPGFEDASAAFWLLLEDLGHHGVARKDRDDQA